jgi:hypothetical protein
MAKNKPTVAGTADDPTIQYAKLTVDGEVFNLCFDFNAIALSEAMAPGSNLLEGLQNLRYLNAVQLRGLLYAAILKAHPKMTLFGAGQLCRLENIPEITEAIASAYAYSIKQPENPIEPTPAAADNES